MRKTQCVPFSRCNLQRGAILNAGEIDDCRADLSPANGLAVRDVTCFLATFEVQRNFIRFVASLQRYSDVILLVDLR
jgi:hypothetical protein